MARIVLAALAPIATVMLLLLSPAAALDPYMPPTPLQYSALVSIGYIDRAMSDSYLEWYDYDLRLLRNDGRGTALDRASVVNLGTNAETSWTTTGPAAQANCETFSIAGLDIIASRLYGVADFMQNDEYNRKYYQGRSVSARSMLCDIWTSSSVSRVDHTLSYDTVVVNNTYYVSVNPIEGVSKVPLRMLINTTTTTYVSDDNGATYYVNNTAQSTMYIDMVRYRSGAQPASKFAPRPYVICAPTTANIQPLERSTVLPAPALGSVPFPKLPRKYTTFLETKLTGGAESLTSAHWYVDLDQAYERIDSYDASLKEDTYGIYKYKQAFEGFFYQITPSKSKCSSEVLSSTGSHPNTSPFSRVRAGSIPDLFAGKHGNFTYTGRSNAPRGIVCDTWVGHNTVTRAGMIYKFNTTVFFSAEGWIHPGQTDSGTRVPVRIVNTGTQQAVGSTIAPVAYVDTWDFFFFVPSVDNTLFDETAFKCPDAPQLLQSLIDQSLENGKTFGIVLGVIGGIALVGAGLFLYQRRMAARRAQAYAAFPLEEATY
ncbi:hypothetical protein CAOG_001128 [Capsaspora owczarzaki ATCC 30864]|uniref:LolA-like domain-containing protein n=2 Tax=Capsaspora owczarzaki (strain ATCC 30864) TaxID=595528 RepID=A0A0D2X0V0_CAPO3|nr:hypothetical protein CAOG_001128 [Capsaspora owczarzaki ATCC 30864]